MALSNRDKKTVNIKVCVVRVEFCYKKRREGGYSCCSSTSVAVSASFSSVSCHVSCVSSEF